MAVAKSFLKFLVVSAVLVGLVLAVGCGGNGEKEKMSAFLQEFSKAVDEYADAVKNNDGGKKTELEAKLESLKAQWTDLKIEEAEKITPQVLDKFDSEFQNLAKKVAELSGKS